MDEFAVDGDPDVDGQALYPRTPGLVVVTEVVLDETRFWPRVDLNGDGDTDDQGMLPTEVLASFLATTVSWDEGAHSLSFVTLVARTNLQATPPEDVTDDDRGGGPPDDHVNFGIGWVNVDRDRGSLGLGVHVDGEAPIIGVKVIGGRDLAVTEIEAEGTTVFSQQIDPPPNGTFIATQPFVMNGGVNTIDSILFVDDRGRPGRVHGVEFAVTFYMESGQTGVVTVGN